MNLKTMLWIVYFVFFIQHRVADWPLTIFFLLTFWQLLSAYKTSRTFTLRSQELEYLMSLLSRKRDPIKKPGSVTVRKISENVN